MVFFIQCWRIFLKCSLLLWLEVTENSSWSEIISPLFLPFQLVCLFFCLIALDKISKECSIAFLSWMRVEFYQKNFLHLLRWPHDFSPYFLFMCYMNWFSVLIQPRITRLKLPRNYVNLFMYIWITFPNIKDFISVREGNCCLTFLSYNVLVRLC